MAELQDKPVSAALARHLVILRACCAGEAIGARLREIDMAAAVGRCGDQAVRQQGVAQAPDRQPNTPFTAAAETLYGGKLRDGVITTLNRALLPAVLGRGRR